MVLVLCGVIALLSALYYLYNALNQKFDYFLKRGIPQLPTEFFYGNGRELAQLKKSIGEAYRDYYLQFKKLGVNHGGVYKGKGKTWIPRDPQLIKKILTKDFVHFSAHFHKLPGLYFNNVFHMAGEEWKDRRRKLTPAFTSGKMKMMFDIILEKSNKLTDLLDELVKKREPFEIKEVVVRFTTDIIASCGFGVDCDSLKDKNADFYKQVQDGFAETDKSVKNVSILKDISVYLGITRPKMPDFKAVEDFFREVMRENLKYREENKVIKKDFVHLMIQLKNKGAVTDLTNENDDVYTKVVEKEVISFEDLTGQCLMFFSAGYGTSSTTISFAMLELAKNEVVQKKLRHEIRKVLKNHNGKLSYDALQEMTYCEQVINETLRKFPGLPVLPRMCTKEYTIPGTNIVIERGSILNIPLTGLHNDPDYFPDPEKFIPDRFSAENKSQITDYTFLPFGEGPRMCLGLRFGVMQSKAGLVTLIKDFHYTLNKKTPYPPILQKSSFVPTVEGGIWLDAVRVD